MTDDKVCTRHIWSERIRRRSGALALLSLATGLALSLPPSSASSAALQSGGLVGQYGGTNRAVAIAGDTAWVGVGSRLVALEVSDSGALHAAAESAPLPGVVDSVALAGELAFVIAENSGLFIVDVAEPQPSVIGFLPIPDRPRHVAVDGRYAYVTVALSGSSLSGKLLVIDVAQPSAPTVAAELLLHGWPSQIEVRDGHAYVLDGEVISYMSKGGSGGTSFPGNFRLLVVDVTDPLLPRLAGQVQPEGGVHAFTIAGNHALLATADPTMKAVGEAAAPDGFRVYDLTDPESPRLIGEDTTPWGGCMEIAAQGTTAAVACGEALYIYDLSTPTAPRRVATSDALRAGGAALTWHGERLIAASGSAGVSVVEADAQGDLAVVGAFSRLANPGEAVLAGEAVVASEFGLGRDPFQVGRLDITDPMAPVQTGSALTQSEPASLVQDGTWVYAMSGRAIEVFDASSQGLTRVDQINQALERPMVAASGDKVVVAGYEYGGQAGRHRSRVAPAVEVYRQTLSGLESLGGGGIAICTDWSIDAAPLNIRLHGDRAYIASWSCGFAVVDVSDAENPIVVGTVSAKPYYSTPVVDLPWAYTLSDGGLSVLDVSDAANPREIAQVHWGWRQGRTDSGALVALAADRIFVADRFGLQVIDVGDPTAPSLLGTLELPGLAMTVAAEGELLAVASAEGGVVLVDARAEVKPPGFPGPTATPPVGQPTVTPVRHEFQSYLPLVGSP